MAKYRITLQLLTTKTVDTKSTASSSAKEAAQRRAWVEALDVKAALVKDGWDVPTFPSQEVEAVDD